MRPLKVGPPTRVVEMSWVLVARRRMSEVCRPFWSAFRSAAVAAAAAVGLAVGPKPVGGQVIEAVAETSERPHFMLFWLWSFRTLDVRMLMFFVDLVIWQSASLLVQSPSADKYERLWLRLGDCHH